MYFVNKVLPLRYFACSYFMKYLVLYLFTLKKEYNQYYSTQIIKQLFLEGEEGSSGHVLSISDVRHIF